MFDFIRKPEIWGAMDAGLLSGISGKLSFQLKTMQDLAVYAQIKASSGLAIAEIGGGDSRVLPLLTAQNKCFNIEPFEGADNGPSAEVRFDGVENIRTRIGASGDTIDDAQFDLLFSISVVEHIEDDQFETFFDDCVRILKPGGKMIHAIDMYVAQDPSAFWRNRFAAYKRAVTQRKDVTPLGNVFDGPLEFTPDIASNPDNIMYGWRQLSPALDALRQEAQSVSLICGVQRN